ncbi:hypothetical protein [Desulfocicer niacini]
MRFEKRAFKVIRWAGIRLLVSLCLCQLMLPCFIHARELEPDGFKIGFHFWKSGDIYENAFQGVIDGLKLGGMS